MLAVGENGPFTLPPVPPDAPVPVVLTGVVVDVGGGGTPPQATISKAVQSRSDIEDVRMACLPNPLTARIEQLECRDCLTDKAEFQLKRCQERGHLTFQTRPGPRTGSDLNRSGGRVRGKVKVRAPGAKRRGGTFCA